MRIGDVYVGIGQGDVSPEVRKIKAYMRRMYNSYAGHLADTEAFDDEMVRAVREMQTRLVASSKLKLGAFTLGIINVETKYAMGYVKRPVRASRPVLFTIEGHMSDWWAGPCAYVASRLEAEGVCWWQPVNYDTRATPFNNASGINEYTRLLNLPVLQGPEGPRPFPAGTPHGLLCFSQGSIIGSEVFMTLRSTNHWRYKDMRGAISFGSPYREKNVVAPWVPDPPKADTQGISPRRITDTPDWWKEHARRGDAYTENPDNEIGLNRSAIYKIVAENSWLGGPASILTRVLDLVTDPTDGVIDMAQSIIGFMMFAVNMGPHGQYDLNPCVDYMRQRLTS